MKTLLFFFSSAIAILCAVPSAFAQGYPCARLVKESGAKVE